jgi:hypothetical protein
MREGGERDTDSKRDSKTRWGKIEWKKGVRLNWKLQRRGGDNRHNPERTNVKIYGIKLQIGS